MGFWIKAIECLYTIISRPEPEPIPEIDEEVSDVEKRRALRRRGRRQAFITGELEPETVDKKRLLG